MKVAWPTHPLSDFVKSKGGNNKIIKGTQSDKPLAGLIQGFSASGPDVWVKVADYSRPGVVISAVGARCGKTFLAEGEWTAIANTHVLLPSDEIDTRWLWYRTNDETFWVRGGSAQPFVKVRETLDQPCVIPPLREQQRIVGILDEAFAGLATAKANAEKNLQNARALFESHLHSVFTQRDKGWVETALGDLCGFVRGPFGGSLKKSIFVADGYAVYEQQHAIYDQFDDVRYFVDETKFKEMKRFELLPNDLIMSCSGTMGRVAIVPAGIKRGIINQALLKLTPSVKTLNTFLKFWMESEAFQDALKEYSGGAAIQNVASVKTLKEIKIPLPSLTEQARVVESIESFAAQTQRLESLYQQKLAAVAALKKSLLHQAFTGQL